MPSPAVSIVMPLYNSEKFLAEAIESILAQTFRDWEFIIILDGCTDRTAEIVHQYRDDRFRIIQHDTNLGIQIALNHGLDAVQSPLFARMDGDDICEPSRLEKQLKFLERNPDVSIVGAYCDYIDDRGALLRPHYPFPTTHESIKDGFRQMNSMAHATTVCRADKLTMAGGYRSDLHVAQDLELWLRCLSKGLRFANIPEVLYHYRQHGVQNTRVKQKLMYRFSNQAYQEYGRLIWGEDAPDIEFGAPLHRRIIRKLRRIARGK